MSVASEKSSGIPAEAWTFMSDLVWPILLLAVLFFFRGPLESLARSVAWRVRSGSALKIAAVEIGPAAALDARKGRFQADGSDEIVEDKEGVREKDRNDVYVASRKLCLVHRIQRSAQDGQHYDILIYVVPHKDGLLSSVKHVEYFFGSFWENSIFRVNDRSRGFPIYTSAYGPFLCTARIEFTDGSHCDVSRYIDFEMGDVAPAVPSSDN